MQQRPLCFTSMDEIKGLVNKIRDLGAGDKLG
jgi:hypothetical protein